MTPRLKGPAQAALGGILVGLWAVVAAVPAANAAESPPEDGLGGGLPPLTVRPSGFEDAEADARARHERLLSRMQQNEFRFRSICTSCGRSGVAPGAPFRPIETLGGPTPSLSQ